MFDLFISLGWYCATASSLQSNGLRDISGPFDWIQTHLDGVIHFLDTEFQDFLTRENCEFVDRGEDDKVIYDRKWGAFFPHEIQKDFEDEWTDLCKKYERRIQRLKDCLHSQRICFVRAVRSQEEIEYIVNNSQYIKNVIERNDGNRIVFLIPQYMYIPHLFPFPYYLLRINVYQTRYYMGLRDLFATAPDFIKYCQENYDSKKREKNLAFDLEKETRINSEHFPEMQVEKRAMEDIDAAYGEIRKLTSQCKRLKLIAAADFENSFFPSKMILYGIGDIGKFFYDKIKNKVNVYCFVDANPKERSYDGIEIVKPEDCKIENETTVLITCDYDFNIIVEKLQLLWGSNLLRYARIEDILN